MFNLHSEDYAVFMINLYNVCSISYLFIVVFVLLLVICYYFITDCLLILSELGFFSFLFIILGLYYFFNFFCDIGTGYKNYENSMVSKIFIS